MWTFMVIYPATIPSLILILSMLQPVFVKINARAVYSRPLSSLDHEIQSADVHNMHVTNYSTSGEKSPKRISLRGQVSHKFHAESSLLPQNCDQNCIAEHWLTHLESTWAKRRRSRLNQSVKALSGVSHDVSHFWLPGRKMLEHYVTITLTNTNDETPADVDFVLDTGSDLTWLQCRPCIQCFTQKRPIFDPSPPHHVSFTKIVAGDSFCNILQRSDQGDGADRTKCKYKVEYGDDSYSKGYVGRDNMRWYSLDGSTHIYLERFAFGCGNKNHLEAVFGSGGVFGLANAGDGISFLHQFKDVTGTSFSFCLPIAGSKKGSGFLDVGDPSLPDPEGYITTPFIGAKDDQGEDGFYYLDVVDFHVDGNPVGIPAGTFNFKPNNLGGFMVDSGSMIMDLVKEGYYPLRDKYREAMIPQLGTQILNGVMGLDTCWDITGKDLPSITAAKWGPIFRDENRMTFGYIASFFTYTSRSKGHTMWCLPAAVAEDPISVMGGYALMQGHAVFNQQNNANVFQWKNDVNIC